MLNTRILVIIHQYLKIEMFQHIARTESQEKRITDPTTLYIVSHAGASHLGK